MFNKLSCNLSSFLQCDCDYCHQLAQGSVRFANEIVDLKSTKIGSDGDRTQIEIVEISTAEVGKPLLFDLNSLRI
jgi:hypothetical protein